MLCFFYGGKRKKVFKMSLDREVVPILCLYTIQQSVVVDELSSLLVGWLWCSECQRKQKTPSTLMRENGLNRSTRLLRYGAYCSVVSDITRRTNRIINTKKTSDFFASQNSRRCFRTLFTLYAKHLNVERHWILESRFFLLWKTRPQAQL
jgi:hypothetical protein